MDAPIFYVADILLLIITNDNDNVIISINYHTKCSTSQDYFLCSTSSTCVWEPCGYEATKLGL